MKKLLLIGVTAIVLAAAVGWLGTQAYMARPIAALLEPVPFEVPEGASLNGVAASLGESGLLQWPRVFTVWGRLSGQAHRIQAGEYLLEPGASPGSILAKFVAGRVRLYPFTILEGWTWREILAALANNPAIVMTLDPANPDPAVLQGILADPAAAAQPEGWFFPETYSVPRGTPDVKVLQQANELMVRQLAEAWESRAVGLPLQTPYELLTLASIVERETAVDSERSMVAGVFMRRLQTGMRLQTDPTVIYGLGEQYDGNLTRRHLLTDNPYNTYTRGGLPPSPIGMAGRASLQAAGHPDAGDALYFVASGDADGTHVFSATLEEHNAAVAAYIAQLRKANRERRQAGGEQ
jgi:UPF0755 protein